jgi:C4-dicarboxylate-specific signal transduction histidine kinase
LIVGVFLGLQVYFKPTPEVMITIQSKMSSVASWQFYILEFLIVLTSILIVIACYNFVNEKTQQLLMKNRSSNEYSTKMSSLGEMAGNIAHEINNPLTIVLGCVFKIKHATKKELIGEKEINTIVESAEKISETVERVGEIVNALQNISRKSDNKMAQTYLKEILKEVISITTFKLKEKQIEFTSYFDSDFMFLGDRVQASQVVLNLVNNAFYASDKNSKPKVCIEFDEDEDFGYLHIVDNGEGVDKENIDRIFEPLFSTKPVGEGTGIGLAISSTMMKTMGGSIDYSRRDDLTYFTIKLPKFKTLES